MSAPSLERRILFAVSAVQFVNIVDFMMVAPLGPDFARELGFAHNDLGLVGAAYTGAAAVAGIIGSFWLDRFDRRVALFLAVLGLGLGTAAGGLAGDAVTLLLARVLAGVFGGPATSLAMSIVADVVPPARRGKALGVVMGAFSIASIVGVPGALELSRAGGWRLPFFVVGALCVALAFFALLALPPLREHLSRRAAHAPLRGLLSRRTVQLSYAMTAVTMAGGFILLPHIPAYLQFNIGYPREHLGLLYLVGGVASFVVVRVGGAFVDRLGSTRVSALAAAAVASVLAVAFVVVPPVALVLPLFVALMISFGLRNVAYNTLATKVPAPNERARFLSLQSAVQHLASATGAYASSTILVERPGGSLGHMPVVALIAIAMALALPFLVRAVEKRVRVDTRQAATPV